MGNNDELMPDDSILFKEDLPSLSKFKEHLNYFKNSNKFTDVSLIALDGKNFMAHRVILAASCPYFRKKFEENPTLRSFSEGINSNVLKLMLDFLYHRIHISNENACDIHMGAIRYQFLDLAHKSLEIMINNILPETSLQYWRYSNEQNIENLRKCCLEFIRADTEIFLEYHIKEFTFEEINQICLMPNLSCPIDLLYHYVMNLWLKRDLLNRKIYLKELVSFFDINFLSYKFVEDNILNDHLLLENDCFKKWISGYKPLTHNFKHTAI